jgi:hypothetical protein
MMRVYTYDNDNPFILGVYNPGEGILYINLSAHRNGLIVLYTEISLIA